MAEERPRRHRGSPRRRPPIWLMVVSACFVLYFGLLAFTDAFRHEPTGLLVHFGEAGAVVAEVVKGSPAERAGFRPGDLVTRYMDRPVRTRLDWTAIDANIGPGDPATVEVRRDGGVFSARLGDGAPRLWRAPGPDTLVLLAARLVQLVCLGLAAVVAFRRPHDRLARLGAWLLASVGVFTLVLPFGFAHYWRLLPALLQLLLWPPFASSIAGSFLFFAFCAQFPQPAARRWRSVVLSSAPGVAAVAWHLRYGYVVVHREARVSIGADWSAAIVVLSVAYAVGGLVLLARQYRQLTDISERRRLRVLLAGTAVGTLAGGLVAAQYWVRSTPRLTHSLFDSPVGLVGVPLLLAFPTSIAYTILRHRVFDLRLIVRQGVRYALARRLLLSLVPLLVLALAADLVVHRERSIVEILRDRGWTYAIGLGGLLITLTRRRRWLEGLDRRFFRERYRAELILRRVLERLREASDVREAIAGTVDQVSQALQPNFVAALGGERQDGEYSVLAATPAFPGRLRLGPDSRVIALSRIVGHSLDLSPDQESWIARHLPPDEAEAVFEAHVELLLPVSMGTGHDVVLVLGPKRSEEPYSGEDLELLEAIASSLGLLLDRRERGRAGEDACLAECPICLECFDTGLARCPHDAALLLASDLPTVLGGRYRLQARLGAGGMGAVYRALDQSLGRTVAIKVLSGDLVGSVEAARRFQLEAKVAASFTHPSVVTIHDFGVTPRARAFLVMEQLHGRTLREALAGGGRLEPARILRIVRDICHVLEDAHGRGLIHRDLKPENIFLTETGGRETTKVLDFGLAKVVSGGTTPTVTSMTRPGLLVGSLPYMAPEQLRGDAPHPRWDLWALAVTAYESLAGARPPQDDRALAAGVEAFFAKALAADPGVRPQTACEFLAQLARALDLPIPT